MRAVLRDRYGPIHALRVEEVERPVPGEGEALVRVQASSLNRADLHSVTGMPRLARIGIGMTGPRFPLIGLDVAGTVEEVGGNVRGLAPGDEVWADLSPVGSGAFADYVCAAEGIFSPRPAKIGFEEAATMPHSAILALQGLRAWGRPISPGHQVLINGAGGCVGPFAVRIAKSHGAEVTGVDSTAKMDLLRAVGADHVVDFTREDVTRNGVSYDRILDIATHRSVLDFRRSLTPDGTYSMIADGLGDLFGAAIFGSLFSIRTGRRMGIAPWKPNDRDGLAHLSDLANQGVLEPVIDRRIGLEEVPIALLDLQQGRTLGKVVVGI